MNHSRLEEKHRRVKAPARDNVADFLGRQDRHITAAQLAGGPLAQALLSGSTTAEVLLGEPLHYTSFTVDGVGTTVPPNSYVQVTIAYSEQPRGVAPPRRAPAQPTRGAGAAGGTALARLRVTTPT